MSKLTNLLLATVFAASAQSAFATCTSGCGTTPTGTSQTTTVGVNPTQITNANLQGGNNTATLTANPTATNTAVLNSNPTLTANPTATNTAVLNSNPTLTANPTATSVANGGQGGSSKVDVGVGVQTTNTLTTGASTATVGNVAATGGDSKATVGNVSTGASTSSATVQQGAVANNNTYSTSTTYKAAANTAMAAGVIGAGHGCFEHKGGFGLGVQALTFGVSGNYNQGENYNKECANDQVDMAIISKGGDPVSNTLAAETAAARSENVRAAIGAIPTSPLLGLFAQFQPAAAPAPAAAAPIIVKVEPTVVTTGKTECSADKPFNPKTGKCGGDLAPR